MYHGICTCIIYSYKSIHIAHLLELGEIPIDCLFASIEQNNLGIYELQRDFPYPCLNYDECLFIACANVPNASRSFHLFI